VNEDLKYVLEKKVKIVPTSAKPWAKMMEILYKNVHPSIPDPDPTRHQIVRFETEFNPNRAFPLAGQRPFWFQRLGIHALAEKHPHLIVVLDRSRRVNGVLKSASRGEESDSENQRSSRACARQEQGQRRVVGGESKKGRADVDQIEKKKHSHLIVVFDRSRRVSGVL